MYEVVNEPARRTVTVRLGGLIRPEEMDLFADAYRRASDIYEGTPHLVLVDSRGLATLERAAAVRLAGALAYGRQRGVVKSVELTDATVEALAAAGLDFRARPDDEVVVECASEEEAQRQLAAALARLFVPVAHAA